MPTLQLPYHPWACFRGSRTPCGLYARQKWLAEASSVGWQRDFKATVAELCSGQGTSGLWEDSPLETVHRLFGLHLTVRDADASIDRALNALLETALKPARRADNPEVQGARLAGLPFAPGRWRDVVAPAALFLSAIFGRVRDPKVLRLYERSLRQLTEAIKEDRDPAAVHNVLRALAVHSVYADHAATHQAVLWLAKRQTPQGEWGTKIPFHQALNALAHLNTPAANDQCRRAFGRLASCQNNDGTWGEDQREWCTFLIVHALRNKGLL